MRQLPQGRPLPGMMMMVMVSMMMMMTLIIMKGLIFLKLEMICLCLNPIQRVTVSECESDSSENLADQLAEWAVTIQERYFALAKTTLCRQWRVAHTIILVYLLASFTNLVQAPTVHWKKKITFQVNIDLLFKSSNSQFWPILRMLDNPPIKEPFILGLFYGSKKPTSASDFLSCFAAEMKKLQMNGLTYNGTLHSVSMSVAICDAPARAFVKNVKYHSGYFGCDKCIQEGEYDGKDISSQKHMLHYELMHCSMKWQMRDTTEAHHHSESWTLGWYLSSLLTICTWCVWG